MHLAALMTGALRPPSWGETAPPAPTSSPPRACWTTLLGALRVPIDASCRGADPFLHPGRAARVLVAGEDAGWLGELHPGVAAEWDLGRVAGFELDLGAVLPHADVVPHYEDLTRFPASARTSRSGCPPTGRPPSWSTWCAARAASCSRTSACSTSTRARARRRWRVRLEFRAADRTLTDEEIAPQRAKIVKAVAEKLEGELRG